MSNKSKFDFADVPSTVPANSIVIRDIGHREGYASITNDAEGTVQTVLRLCRRLGETVSHNTPPLYYYDSDGRLDQLEHDGDGFLGFKAGPAQ